MEQDFCVEILPLIKEAQNQHGLRHGDYQRYRKHNYVLRVLFRCQRCHHQNLTRFLLIPLVCAERTWALDMELKQHANTELRKRFHLLRRLGRAVKHAEDLLALCEGCVRCDAHTRLEAQAYCSWMVGHLRFEQQRWQEAHDAFGQTHWCYPKLKRRLCTPWSRSRGLARRCPFAARSSSVSSEAAAAGHRAGSGGVIDMFAGGKVKEKIVQQ